MRKFLCTGAADFEILPGSASVLKFADKNAALNFLRRFRNDAAQMAVFRAELSADARDFDRLDADQTLDRFAALLVSGRVRLLRSYQIARGAATGDKTGSQKKKDEPAKLAPNRAIAKKTWVEFRVVADETGDPLEGVELTVRLPDGSIEVQTTDAGGYVEFNDIFQGDCEVRCDLTEAELSKSLVFVRVS